MRSLGVRLPILAVAACAGIGLSVSCVGVASSQTVYVMPTVATVAWPTSYVSTASYVIPTSYSFPSYLPAAYVAEPVTVAPSAYLTTAYTVRRGLFGRLRLVERPVIASYGTTYLPSSYVVPTTYVPSSYVVPTTYVPSSYVVPTTYAPSSYVVPTTYLPSSYVAPTSYVRSSYVVPTTYYSTSYPRTSYVSTSYSSSVFDYPRVGETSYVSSSALDCEPVPCDPPRVASVYRDSPRVSQPAEPSVQSYPAPSPTGPTKSTPSTAREPESIPSNVEPLATPAPLPRADTQGATRNATPESRADSPPKPPTPQREQSTAAPLQPAPGGAGAGTANPPTDGANAPANTKPVPPAAPTGEPTDLDVVPSPPTDKPLANRRESLRPAFNNLSPVRTELRNVLVGRVESESGEPRGEVPISVARVDNSSIRRAGMTDAFGNFAIRLADGEWNVNVRMPSGRFYKVRSVTVNNGRIVDNQELREVRNLIVSY